MPHLYRVILPLFLLGTSLLVSATAHAQHVTSMTYSDKGELLVGWSDSHIATLDIKRKRGTIKRLHKTPNPILAISPDGSLAIHLSDPPTLVRTSDGATLLDLSELGPIQGVLFPDGGQTLMIATQNKIYIWKESNKLISLLKKGVQLEIYLAKQKADLQVSLGTVRGPLAFDDATQRLAFADAEGHLTLWEKQNPSEAAYVARVKEPHTSLAIHHNILLATTPSQELRAIHIADRKPLPWAKNLKATRVVAHPNIPQSFLLLGPESVALHSYETGEATWTLPFPTGTSCGATLWTSPVKGKPDAQLAAICHDDTIHVISLEDAKTLVKFKRVKTKITTPK